MSTLPRVLGVISGPQVRRAEGGLTVAAEALGQCVQPPSDKKPAVSCGAVPGLILRKGEKETGMDGPGQLTITCSQKRRSSSKEVLSRVSEI